MKSPIHNLILLGKKFSNFHKIKWNNSFLQWNIPDIIKVDFALSLAIPISAKNKLSVREVAQEFVNLIKENWNLKWEITEKGYINFHLPSNYYYYFFCALIKSRGKNLQLASWKKININIEYISANPTGQLHLGNLRPGVIADTLANIYDFAGCLVTREYYINDRGEQIKQLVDSIHYFYKILQNSSYIDKKKTISYPGKESENIAKKLIDKWGNKYLDKKINQELFLLWKKEILRIIISRTKRILKKCGIRFDVWFSEDKLYKKNKHLELIEKLKKKKLIYSKEKATFLRTSITGDEKDRVIIKQDGNYTYFFSDILYHENKLSRSEYLINFWGADHHGYIERVLSSIQLLGYKREKIKIILTQMVSLWGKEGERQKLSKRLGNTISVVESLKLLGKDQLRFSLIEKDSNVHLNINKKLLEEQKEKSRLYYIQYAHARCHQIIIKSKELGINENAENFNLLVKEKEKKLLSLSVRFSFIISLVIEENKPQYLVNYVEELAQVFQNYYQNSTIIVSEQKKESAQRILLVKGVKEILSISLSLIGVSSPEVM